MRWVRVKGIKHANVTELESVFSDAELCFRDGLFLEMDTCMVIGSVAQIGYRCGEWAASNLFA